MRIRAPFTNDTKRTFPVVHVENHEGPGSGASRPLKNEASPWWDAPEPRLDDPRHGHLLRRRPGPPPELLQDPRAPWPGSGGPRRQRPRESAAGIQISKADKNSPNRIDLAVCAVMAFDRASKAKTRAPLTVDWF